MNANAIKQLKEFLRASQDSTHEVVFSIDDDNIYLLGWDFIPGLKNLLIDEINGILDFVDGTDIEIEITLEYDQCYNIVSIFYNGRFWDNIPLTE